MKKSEPHSVSWQKPFVDTFKHFGVWKPGYKNKQGHIFEDFDTFIGRSVFRITGKVSSANTLALPEENDKNSLPLALEGRFCYIQFLPYPNSFFHIHLDFLMLNNQSVRLSLSNMYKTQKVSAQTIQIPIQPINNTQWATYVLDIEHILRNSPFHHENRTYKHLLQKITICSNLSIRNIYTSDELYNTNNLPKELCFKLTRQTDNYNQHYGWCELPMNLSQMYQEECIVNKREQTHKENVEKKNEKVQLKVERQNMRKTQQQMLETHHRIEVNDEKLKEELELERCVGFTGVECPEVRLFSDGILFTSGSNLIEQKFDTKQQKIITGHSQKIQALDLSKCHRFIASGQDGPNSQIKIFDRKDYLCIYSWLTEYQSVTYINFSPQADLLVTVGKNQRNQEIIIVWDLTQKDKYQRPTLLAKQLSDISIICTKFSPYDPNILLSCGRENIRFLRIKKGYLPATPVILNHYARNTVFTILDFDLSAQTKRVYIGSSIGLLFLVNYESRELEGVFKVHDGGIYGLKLSQGFCVTGSDDSFLRVWPLDFSEYFLEAKHEGGVVGVDVSDDGLLVGVGSAHGGLGIMDLAGQSYKTVLRSHYKDLRGIDYSKKFNQVLTVSQDGTIRVWSEDGFEQLYEFSYPSEDECLVIAMHPNRNFFVGGFDSGTIRVFDVENTCIISEKRYHQQPISNIKFNDTGDKFSVVDKTNLYHILNFDDLSVDVSLHQSSETENPQFIFTENYWITPFDDKTIQFTNPENHKPLLKAPINNTIQKIIVEPKSQNDDYQNIIIITKENSIKQYKVQFSQDDISFYLVKEIPTAHQNRINDLIISQDKKCIITIGDDRMIKIWDRNYKKKNPVTYIQHISNAKFIQQVGEKIITIGGNEGIYVWNYLAIDGQWVEQSKLSLIKQNVFNKKSQLYKQNNNIQTIQDFEQEDEQNENQPKPIEKNFSQTKIQLQKGQEKIIRLKKCQKERIEPQNNYQENDIEQKVKQIENNTKQLSVEYVLGYNSKPNNFIWGDGILIYSLENMLIFEKLSANKKQNIIQFPNVISCIASDPQQNILYIGTSSPTQDYYPVYVFNYQKRQIEFIHKDNQYPISQIHYCPPTHHLITTNEENQLYLYNINNEVVYANQTPSPVKQIQSYSSSPLQFAIQFDDCCILMNENQNNSTDLPYKCDHFVKFTNKGLFFIYNEVLYELDENYQIIQEQQIDEQIQKILEHGYQTQNYINYRNKCYNIKGNVFENTQLEELMVQTQDGWYHIRDNIQKIGIRGNQFNNVIAKDYVFGDGQLWDLHSGIQLGYYDYDASEKWLIHNNNIYQIQKGKLWQLNEEQFGKWQSWEGVSFDDTVNAWNDLIITKHQIFKIQQNMEVQQLYQSIRSICACNKISDNKVALAFDDGEVLVLEIKDNDIYIIDQFQVWMEVEGLNTLMVLFLIKSKITYISSRNENQIYFISEKYQFLVKRDIIEKKVIYKFQTERIPLKNFPTALKSVDNYLIIGLKDGFLNLYNDQQIVEYRQLLCGPIESIDVKETLIVCTNQNGTITLRLNK